MRILSKTTEMELEEGPRSGPVASGAFLVCIGSSVCFLVLDPALHDHLTILNQATQAKQLFVTSTTGKTLTGDARTATVFHSSVHAAPIDSSKAPELHWGATQTLLSCASGFPSARGSGRGGQVVNGRDSEKRPCTYEECPVSSTPSKLAGRAPYSWLSPHI